MRFQGITELEIGALDARPSVLNIFASVFSLRRVESADEMYAAIMGKPDRKRRGKSFKLP
jgi:hypothetical protein